MTVSAQFEELALANRILFNERIVDAFGHISVRAEPGGDRFLLSRSMAPALVTVDDILTFDFTGTPTAPSPHPLFLERFIHAEIYRNRPDVTSVIHSHSSAILPFTVSPLKLRPVFHMGSVVPMCTPVFEIRKSAGDSSNLLISSCELGSALAVCLGNENIVLMRGHGMTVVGNSIRQTVFRAIYTVENARVQTQAHAMGGVEYLTPGEAKAAAEANDKQMNRAWDLWVKALDDPN